MSNDYDVPEFIAAAAVEVDGLIFTTPPPGRHHTVCELMYKQGIPQAPVTSQGFITSYGRFVDRITGCLIAAIAGQLDQPGRPKTNPQNVLFSEDLW